MDLVYVSFTGHKIFVENVKEINLKKELIKIGFQESKRIPLRFEIAVSGKEEISSFYVKLRDLGILFSAGKDWSPAAQFEELRDKGLITGKFKMIGWSGPDKYEVIEK
ncbi:MAG: hypothetical protein PHV60_06740 [bacterium]|nr:hypothetical protein [bacterium]